MKNIPNQESISSPGAFRMPTDAGLDSEIIEDDGPVVKPLYVAGIMEFMAMDFPPREKILSPWLDTQGLCMVHALRGVGKTYFSIGVACAVATGSRYLQWEAPKPRGVIFIDGEMPVVVLQKRLTQTLASGGDIDTIPIFRVLTPDLQELGMPDLSTYEGQQRVEPHINDDIELVIIDNISTLCGSQQENRADTWRQMQDWLLSLRARGKSVLMVHHDGKGGSQRGSIKKEDILDTVIQLRRPSQYNPTDGAVFEVHFTKSRGLHGEEVEPFEASLIDGSNWATKKIEDSTKEKVKKLMEDGLKQKDIAVELDITPGRVSQIMRKIKQEV